MEYLASIKKALVPVGVAGGLAVLGWVGVTGDMSVREAVTLLVTAGLSWFVLNVPLNI